MISKYIPCLFFLFLGFNATAKIQKDIHKAIETGDKERFLKIIKDKNIDLNVQDEDGMTPLMSAALAGEVHFLKDLLKRNVQLEKKNKLGDTALAVAVSNEQFRIAKELILAGAQVDILVAGDEKDTLLIRAASLDKEITKLILKKNKKVLNKTNDSGTTALMQSVRFGFNDILKILISEGADVSLRNKAGLTALDIAKQSDNSLAVQILSKK
jgi:ankyrin repeat protein